MEDLHVAWHGESSSLRVEILGLSDDVRDADSAVTLLRPCDGGRRSSVEAER